MAKTSSTLSSIPTIDLALFDYSKQKRTLQLSRDLYGTPREFFVQSHKTGRVVHFVQDHDDMMANECYDGEATSYKPVMNEAPCNIIRAFIVNWQ